MLDLIKFLFCICYNNDMNVAQSYPTLCDPMTAAFQASLFMEFSRQEYWSGLPRPPSEDLPNAGMEPVSLMSLELASRFFTTNTTWETPSNSLPSFIISFR